MTESTIKIANCNSIDQADITIKHGRLNIKYGPNGIGKSTISKAIVAKIRDDDTLSELLPFKHRHKNSQISPIVEGTESFNSALIFDEDFVNQFAFQQDEVVQNSYEIFIKTPEYDEAMSEIAKSFDGIRNAFQRNEEIEQTVKDLKDLRDAFGKANKDGTVAKSSKVMKAFGGGNKIDNIPDQLLPFESFIKSDKTSKWAGWQIKGNEFLEIGVGDKCPYCAGDMSQPEQKETALTVANEINATDVNHLNTLKEIIERLKGYFSDQAQENLEKIVGAKIELTKAETTFLGHLKTSITTLIAHLEDLQRISFFSLRDVEEIELKLQSLKIDLGMISHMNSAAMVAVVDPINEQLNKLLNQVGELKGKVNAHKAKIKKTIAENETSINNFLKSAGYRYKVSIVAEAESYKMLLEHEDLKAHVEKASQHLSYGERNAFALVLFLHQVNSENPGLVILDDPISSFDKNKKFAILHELFIGKGSLKNFTTLLLTHDIEPAIDVVKIKTSEKFQAAKPTAFYLSSQNGVVSEKEIQRDDIQPFGQICKTIVESNSIPLIKAIYLRRKFEISDDYGLEYNLLASLFHGRDEPTFKSMTEDRNMTVDEIDAAQKSIRESIPDFDYNSLLTEIRDISKLVEMYNTAASGYEKIQLFRLIRGHHDDDIITKFINESYHIENEYIMQLNPRNFDIIPEYVVRECDRLLNSE